MPPIPVKTAVKLRVPQIRVLQVLAELDPGLGMTRARLSDICGNRTGVVVGRAIGYSDPVKRAAFEQTKDGGGRPGKPCPSLLTLDYVKEFVLDLDGITEVHIAITSQGRQALKAIGDIQLPEIHDSYADKRS